MALMTSSSGTSSAVPAKEVSRRFMRMARALSAVPRSALISCRRSVSLRGRKSMVDSPLRGTRRTIRLRSGPESAHPLRTAGQFREQQVHAAVHVVVVQADGQQVVAPHDEVADLLAADEHA